MSWETKVNLREKSLIFGGMTFIQQWIASQTVLLDALEVDMMTLLFGGGPNIDQHLCDREGCFVTVWLASEHNVDTAH